MNGSFGFSEQAIEMKQPSIDSILDEVKKIHKNLEKNRRISELEIKDYTRRIKDLYNTTISTKQEIFETFRVNPDKLIEFQKKEKILQGVIKSLKNIFENCRNNSLVDLDNNLDNKAYHHAINNNQKEETIQIAIKTLDKFFE